MEESRRRGIREWYERRFLFLGKLLAKLGISPNYITLSSILVMVMSTYFFWLHNIPLSISFFLIAVFLDVLDGSLARASGKVTKFGMLLDHFSDRCVEFLLVLGLVLGGYIPGRLGVLLFFSMILPSYVRARGEAISGISGEGIGFFERKEKIGSLLAGILLEIWIGGVLYFVAILVSVLSLITAGQRIYFYYKILKNKE